MKDEKVKELIRCLVDEFKGFVDSETIRSDMEERSEEILKEEFPDEQEIAERNFSRVVRRLPISDLSPSEEDLLLEEGLRRRR